MHVFKTLDTRGLSFFSATDQMNQAFKDVNKNGILEIILDKKKNFSEAFSRWVESKGYKIWNRDEDTRLVRLFIRKVTS